MLCQDSQQFDNTRAGRQVTVQHLRLEAETNALALVPRWAANLGGAVPVKEAVGTPPIGPRNVEAVALGEKGIPESAAEGSGGTKIGWLKLGQFLEMRIAPKKPI